MQNSTDTPQSEEVDEIIARWSEARPDIDVSPLAVFSRLMRVAKHLSRARAQAFERSGLEMWEFDVLAVLRRAGEPYRQNAKTIVEQTMVTSGTMTTRIDRLVARGLVSRHSDPNDGRAIIIEMTKDGKTLVDAAFTRLIDAEEVLLGGMTKRERDTLARMLRKLSESVKNHGSHPIHGGKK